MKSLIAALLFGLGVISGGFASASSKDYIVTKGPAGIFSLSVTSSGVSVVKGPFVPYPTPGPCCGNPYVQTDPTLMALSPNGEFLYALYGSYPSAPYQVYTLQMINGIPVYISRYQSNIGPSPYGDDAMLMAASANHVFLVIGPFEAGDSSLWVFKATNGILNLKGSYLLPTVGPNPLSIQIRTNSGDPSQTMLLCGRRSSKRSG